MSQPTPSNTEPKFMGDMASGADDSSLGVQFNGIRAKVPTSGIGEMNTKKAVETPADNGGTI